MTTDYSLLEVTPNSVIVIRDDAAWDEDALDELVASVRQEFPNNLIVWMDRGTTWETLDEETLQTLLADLIEHRKHLREGG